ncbi:hypothetical protein D9758_002402 [Tetrapyrgos nigripes]|uniref:Uncharacterized protein n=1 Tax=Tetrapyrgos nigripes TaxID=182062 RepID=A0A8H5LT66_9AGAR|nr:hypothetical protein D9758_002402 [Tetrapyrgos nigripes]
MSNHQEELSEHSALLPNVSLPSISSGIAKINALGPDRLDMLYSETDVLRPQELSNHRTLQTAYSLAVLLSLRAEYQKVSQGTKGNSWDQWSAEKDATLAINAIERNIKQVWTATLRECSKPQDIDTVLWMSIPAEEGKDNTVRVVDFLTHPTQAPTEVLSHRLIHLSLLDRWRRGPSLDFSRSRHYLTIRYDGLCTPRVVHAIELVIKIVFFVLLMSYTLHPPDMAIIYAEPLEAVGWREGFLIFLSLALSLSTFSLSNLPSYITFLAFFSALPSVPHPENLSFSFLLLSVFVLLFQLHEPHAPSPLFLFPHERTLPFAVFLHQGLQKTVGNLLLFFLPILLVSTFLLSSSLADTPFPPLFFQLATEPTPVETRTAYFLLSFMVLFVGAISFFVTIPTVSFLPSPETSHWDRYSVTIGNIARASFFREVVAYSQPYPFPSVFNVVRLILVRIPIIILDLFGVDHPFMEKFERILWRVTVGPVVLLVTVLAIPLS